MKPTTNPTNKQIVGGFNRKETWVVPWIYEHCEAPVYEIASKILKSDLEAEHVTNRDISKTLFRKGTEKELSKRSVT